MKLEVRCCCDAGKLMGWLDVPYESATLPRSIRFQQRSARGAMDFAVIDLQVAKLKGPTHDYLALKADGLPIETLRRIPGFVEA